MSVYQKLSEARAKFHALPLKKTGHNKFAGYYYFELGDFLIPALTVFREVGLLAVVSFTSDTASMTITDLEDGSSIVITSPMGSAALKGCHEVQNIGAVETYQRRYLWVAALEIVEHDALDAVTGSDKGEPDRKPAKLTAEEVAAYISMIEQATTKEAVKEIWNEALQKCKDASDKPASDRIKAAVIKQGEFIDGANK